MVFRSAGFLSPNQSCPAPLVQVMEEWGIDVSAHRSYQVDEASLAAADLVLTMEGQHVQKATLLLQSAFPKVMPLKEAAHAMAATGGNLDALLSRVAVDRDPTSYLSSRWDVDDPYNRKLKDYRRAVNEISGLVDEVVGRLGALSTAG